MSEPGAERSEAPRRVEPLFRMNMIEQVPSDARSPGAYVYIGLLSDGRFYVGVSQQQLQDLRIQHRSGEHSRFTKDVGFKHVIWTEPHPSLASAMKRERQLKRWTHAKKQALIDGDLARLKALSRRKTP